MIDEIDDAGTDPFMIWITPKAQYANGYTVATAESNSNEDYFQV